MVELSVPIRYWKCPSCDIEDRTQRSDTHTQFHHCKAVGGAALPMIEVPNLNDVVDGRHVLVMREDYCGDKLTSPISAVKTERADGSNDCTVFAPTAVVQFSS